MSFSFLVLLFHLPFACRALDEQPVVFRIAFGSCSNQSAPQPIWNAIVDFDPQLFVWLGDNIYGDIRRPFKILGKERTIGPWKNAPRFIPSTEQEMMLRYKKAKENPGYMHLRSRTQVIGTWDDHDYGLNDAGKEFGGKDVNQRLMLDFLDEPNDSPRCSFASPCLFTSTVEHYEEKMYCQTSLPEQFYIKKIMIDNSGILLEEYRREQAGIYASYMFGPEGKQIKVILLDTRYHRDPLFSDGTILGESQWRWLGKELRGPKSEITIIASSIQVISNISATTGPLFYLESWGRFPKERDRLYKLIDNSKRDGVFFISGDVHFGEIARYDCVCQYPLYDVTSSGLTQAVEKAVPSPLALLLRLAAWINPTTMRVFNEKCWRRSCTYGQPNFGSVIIDWNATPITMRLDVRDINGDPIASVNILLSELQSRNMQKAPTKTGELRHHCTLEIDLPWIIRYRLAIFFYGVVSVLSLAWFLLIYKVVSISGRRLRKFKLD